MHKFHLALASMLLTVCVARGARADEQSYRKAVQEYFTLAQMDVVMQRSMEMALGAQVRANPQFKKLEPKMREFLSKYMSWKSLQDDFTGIYMRAFTEDEFKQLLAFYKTPVGRKSLQKMPTLMEEGAAIGAKRVQEHMPELQKLIEDAMKSDSTSSTSSGKAAH